ncbi:hypothetical protein ACO2I3_10325 [Leptospira interrogans]
MSASWTDMRILVVEDDIVIALPLVEHLKEAGAEVIGPITDVSRALHIASHDTLSGAVLDVNLGKLDVWPVARMLASRGIPFIFATASSPAKLQAASFGDVPRLSKPYREADAAEALLSLIPRAAERLEPLTHASAGGFVEAPELHSAKS